LTDAHLHELRGRRIGECATEGINAPLVLSKWKAEGSDSFDPLHIRADGFGPVALVNSNSRPSNGVILSNYIRHDYGTPKITIVWTHEDRRMGPST
jgi:hypothetical protein